MPPNGDPEGNAVIIFFRMKIELSGAHYRGDICLWLDRQVSPAVKLANPGSLPPWGTRCQKKNSLTVPYGFMR